MSEGGVIREVGGDRLIQHHPGKAGGKPYIKVISGTGQKGAEARLDRLKCTVQALAVEAAEQLAIYPDFVATPDELALDFSHWLSVCQPLLTTAQLQTMLSIDSLLSEMGGPNVPWSENDLKNDIRWGNIRLKAKSALEEVGWASDNPPPSPDTFVKFDK